MSTIEPVSPDELTTQQENELICSKLLEWKPWQEPGKPLRWKRMFGPRSWEVRDTPAFNTWADIGMVMSSLKRQPLDRLELSIDDEGDWKFVLEWDRHQMHRSRYGVTAPEAIRKGTLEYVRSLP